MKLKKIVLGFPTHIALEAVLFLLFIRLGFAMPEVPKIPKEATCQQVIEHLKEPQIKRSTTASDLNVYGMRCYKENKLEEARELFRFAVTLDDNHVLAHYNLACVLARLVATVGPCEMNSEWSQIFPLLTRSIKLNPKRADRARTDSDFDGIRYMLQLGLSIEGQPTNSAEMASLFDGITLWGESPGAALLAEIRFKRMHVTAMTGIVEGWMLDSGH
jgi:tetratricopeptide (TPR) repeat protein